MTEDYVALIARLRAYPRQPDSKRWEAADVIEKLTEQILIDGRKDGEGIEYQARALAAEARLARAEDCIEQAPHDNLCRTYQGFGCTCWKADYKKGAHND